MSSTDSTYGDGVKPPTTLRDGLLSTSNVPIVYDVDYSQDYQDITYQISTFDLCARIAFNRLEILNAFRPTTIREIQHALERATDDVRCGVILLSGNVNVKKFTPAFCVGGDQRVRSNKGGYQDGTETGGPKLRVLDLQVQMRRCPKPIVAVVDGYAIGGGHILHMLCDLTICTTESVFGQTGPKVGSFDAGYGSTHMARLIGQKKARELWFLCRFVDAHEAKRLGLVNEVVKREQLEQEVARWVRQMNRNSPTALACCKAAINADEEGAEGIAELGGQLTRMFYQSAEGEEGRKAFLQKRNPQFRSNL